jgi:hypothetical protein
MQAWIIDTLKQEAIQETIQETIQIEDHFLFEEIKNDPAVYSEPEVDFLVDFGIN